MRESCLLGSARGMTSRGVSLLYPDFFRILGFKYIAILATPDAEERIAALVAAGYEPFDKSDRENFYMKMN